MPSLPRTAHGEKSHVRHPSLSLIPRNPLMADVTVANSRLSALAQVLSQVAVLTPPPAPKGRYVLSKATPKVIKEAQAHEAAVTPLLDDFATCDAEGTPIFVDLPGGGRSFAIRSEKQAEWNAIQDELVTLAGVRQLTRAELGACPITVQQEMVLIECGLLEDAEPV